MEPPTWAPSAQLGPNRLADHLYGYFLVASGWADICLDPIMNAWDIAALIPIIRGSGGVISDWHGGAAYPADSTVAAATPTTITPLTTAS